MTRHVYILGAGFSVPLGGPLFADLLTIGLHTHVQVKHPEPYGQAINKLIVNTDAQGFKRELDIGFGRGLNPFNAEELLALLDWAINNADKSKARRLYSSLTPDPSSVPSEKIEKFFEGLRPCLKRTIAAQCNSFVDDIEEKSDLIKPYETWVSKLSSDDTIISFNYDRSIERIAEIASQKTISTCVSPVDNAPRLLNLHGSACWKQDGLKLVFEDKCYEKEFDVCIGLPGKDKASLEHKPPFYGIWNEARAAIGEADIISIIGYSMPETDNMAREAILQSMREGQRVNLIMGPQSMKERSLRIQSMVHPVVRPNKDSRGKVVDLRMYAQDYIAAVERYQHFEYE